MTEHASIRQSLEKLLAEGRIPPVLLLRNGSINQSALARRLGITAAAVNQWFSGETRWPHISLQRQLATTIGVQLTEVGEPGIVDFDSRVTIADGLSGAIPFTNLLSASIPNDVAVYKTGASHEDGTFTIDTSLATDFVRRPPILAGVKDAFAIYLDGDTMEPWRCAGDPIHVNPARSPAIGSHVLIVMKSVAGALPLACVKRLVGRTGAALTVQQYNPPCQGEIALDTVAYYYRIMEVRDLFGIA